MVFLYSTELLSVTSRMLLMVIIIIANDDNKGQRKARRSKIKK